jgi:transcriptional regulator with XRE-family HTH domain
MPPRVTGSIGSSRALSRRITYEREQRGWKQVKLAKLMTDAGFDMTQSTISKIENDDPPRRITVDELVGFSQVFRIRADELLLPPELVVDKAARKLLEDWRAARVADAEAFGRLYDHLRAHPTRADSLLEELMTVEDHQALLAKAEAGMKKIFRDFETKHGRPATVEDMKAAAEQVAAREKESRRGQRRTKT